MISLVALFVALHSPQAAGAATISVDSLADDGGAGCQLRAAVTAANADAPSGGCLRIGPAGADTIDITVPGTISLNVDDLGEVVATSEMDIVGLGEATTQIRQTLVGRVLRVSPAGDLGLTSLTVRDGFLAASGAGIWNEGVLSLDHVKVTNNQSVGEDGAGIFGDLNSTTTVTDSEIGPDNIAGAPGGDGDGRGGGIAISGGTLNVQGSVIHHNEARNTTGMTTPVGEGGGIYADTRFDSGAGLVVEPSVTIGDSTVSDNIAAVDGGGVWIRDGTLMVNNALIADNEAQELGPGSGDGAGAGIFVGDFSAAANTHQILDSVVSGNEGRAGGGLFSTVSSPQSTTIDGTTNTAMAGGGALFYGDAAIVNSTFSGNTATNNAGGIAANASGASKLGIDASTLAGNSAPYGSNLLFNGGGGSSVILKRSVLDDPVDPSGGLTENCASSDTFTSEDFNVVSDLSCGLVGDDLEGVAPLLNPLADNGGPHAGTPPGSPILTHGLTDLSPALDIASCTALAVDQRDIARPFGAKCDAGAVEFTDADADGDDDVADNCPGLPNPGQADTDGDGVGDACDSTPNGDSDGDGVDNAVDNCPGAANPGQTDSDGDGIGNACDSTPFGPSASSATTPASPSNALELGKLVLNKKKGIAFLFVTVPGSGQIDLAGKGLKPLRLGTQGGRVKLVVKPHKKGKQARKLRKRLAGKGKAALKLRVTYTPTGGTSNTQGRKLKLILKRRK